MADKNFKDSCPGRHEETLTFSNCTPVTGSDNPANPNTILFIDDEIRAVVAFSLENTGNNNILLTVIFSDNDPTFVNIVEDGSSFASVFDNVEAITIQNNAGSPITGTFKYQITYTFDV
ncbi:MAG: S-Ena type endospore appendage [Bacillaceae bacterium]